jgi:hypothetical protein
VNLTDMHPAGVRPHGAQALPRTHPWRAAGQRAAIPFQATGLDFYNDSAFLNKAAIG